MITENSTFRDVEALPGWKEIGRYVMEARPTTREKYLNIPLTNFNYHGKNKVVDALNFVNERISGKDQIMYDYYSEEEIKNDPDLEMTKILFFKGKPYAPYVVVCPGGGYHNVVTYLEGFPAAKCFCEKGYNVFVVTYRTRIAQLLPKPMRDLHKALAYIQVHKDLFEIGDNYAVMGCSAGGHLISELMTDNFGYATANLEKPSALVICYAPVKVRAAEDLFEEGYDLDDFNILNHMKYSIPVYTFHCKNDGLVPVEQYYERLDYFNNHNWSIKGCLYETGGHGLQDDHPACDDDWFTPIRDYLDTKL